MPGLCPRTGIHSSGKSLQKGQSYIFEFSFSTQPTFPSGTSDIDIINGRRNPAPSNTIPRRLSSHPACEIDIGASAVQQTVPYFSLNRSKAASA